MKYFLYKLLPPRPTFPQDMTEAEGELIQEHINYWKTLVDKRIAVIFGPVADPRGIYGLAIIETLVYLVSKMGSVKLRKSL
jgi:hypothetical protein